MGLANLLSDYEQDVMTKTDYYRILKTFTRGQHKDNRPWIAENYDGMTGRWIGDYDRSRHYNHSTWNDLIITGLVGIRPRKDDTLEVNPLIPQDSTGNFMLDGVAYKGRRIAVAWDRTGSRFSRGQGMTVFIDGRPAARTPGLSRIRVPLRAPALQLQDGTGAVRAERAPGVRRIGDVLRIELPYAGRYQSAIMDATGRRLARFEGHGRQVWNVDARILDKGIHWVQVTVDSRTVRARLVELR